MNTRLALAASLVLAASGLGGLPLEAQSVGYSIGAQYATGSYIFDERIHAFYLTNTLRLKGSRLEMSASVPLVVQNGGLVSLVAGGVPVPTGGEQAAVVASRRRGETVGTRKGPGAGGPGGAGGGAALQTTTTVTQATDSVFFEEGVETHLADPMLSASVEIKSGFGTLRSLRVNAAAKVPATDVSSGVGTGEWDYGAGASMVFGLGSVLAFADLQYWWLGDLPELELSDGLSYGLGLGRSVFQGEGTLLLTLTGMSRTISSMDAPVSAALSLGRNLSERAFLTVGAGAGLTEAAPDFFASVGVSFGR